MKKTFAIVVVLLTGLSLYNALAQIDPLEITITEDNVTAANEGTSVTVQITGSYPSYTISLYAAEPWKGAQPIEIIADVDENEYTLTNLTSGVYFVCVSDAKENLDCEKVEIDRR